MMFFFLFLAINIQFYTIKMTIISSPFQIVQVIVTIAFLMDTLAFAAIVPLLAYYEHLRINKINKQIKMVKNEPYLEVIAKTVKTFTEEHNLYCSHIDAVNKFWKNLFLTLMVSALPFNLTAMHQLLFESVTIEVRLIFAFGMIIHGSVFFGIQYCFSLLSIKIHSMYEKLSRLQWCLNRKRMSVKLQLIICFERLVSKKKIGITFGSVVFVMPVFAKVNIL